MRRQYVHSISSRKDYQMYDEVPNPESYPKKAFNEDCEKCNHGQVVFFRLTDTHGNETCKYQSTLCSASKMLVCQRGFIKPKEFKI